MVGEEAEETPGRGHSARRLDACLQQGLPHALAGLGQASCPLWTLLTLSRIGQGEYKSFPAAVQRVLWKRGRGSFTPFRRIWCVVVDGE